VILQVVERRTENIVSRLGIRAFAWFNKHDVRRLRASS